MGIFCDLLKLNKDEFRKWLITRQIESFNENVLIPINKEAADTSRDALAKHIYAKVFQYIVEIINKNLISGKSQNHFIGSKLYRIQTITINIYSIQI